MGQTSSLTHMYMKRAPGASVIVHPAAAGIQKRPSSCDYNNWATSRPRSGVNNVAGPETIQYNPKPTAIPSS